MLDNWFLLEFDETDSDPPKSLLTWIIYLFETDSFSLITQSSGGVIYHENLILRTHYPFRHQTEQQNAPYLKHSLKTQSRYSISIRASYVTGPCQVITKRMELQHSLRRLRRLRETDSYTGSTLSGKVESISSCRRFMTSGFLARW